MTIRFRVPAARSRVPAVAAVAALTAGAVLAGPLAAPAAAIDILTTAGAVTVTEQSVLISWVAPTDDAPGRQRMLIDARATGQVDPGAQSVILLASPAPLTGLSVATNTALAAASEASAPEVTIEEAWWPDLDSFGGRPEEGIAANENTFPVPPGGLDPLGAESAQDWLNWLTESGYELSDQEIAIILRYTGAGWPLSRITVDIPPGNVNGGPPPLELTFDTNLPILPVYISSANTQSFTLTSYVLAAERMDRADALRGNATTLFSGTVTAAEYPDLADWLAPFGGSAVLTKGTQTFPVPSRITEDISFKTSAHGDVSAGTETRTIERIIFGLPAGIMLVAFGLLAIAVLGITASQLLQRRHRE